MLITPEYVFKDVTHITPEWLAAKGITALVLDIDNTLTADRSQELPEEVAAWLAAMRKAGVKLTIVSNGAEKRVRPSAEKLGLAYLYRSAKPLPFALGVARRRIGVAELGGGGANGLHPDADTGTTSRQQRGACQRSHGDLQLPCGHLRQPLEDAVCNAA